jgi:hypothetical protein
MHDEVQALSRKLIEAGGRVAIGARYMHYKQLSYKVLSIGLREEDCEPCVVYQAEYGDKLIWVRPVSSWLEEIELKGKKVKRFVKLP